MGSREPFEGELQAEKADRGLGGAVGRMTEGDPVFKAIDGSQQPPVPSHPTRRPARIGDGLLEEEKRSRTWMWSLLGIGSLIVARWLLRFAE